MAKKEPKKNKRKRRESKTPDEIMQTDYWNGRDSEESRKKARTQIKRKRNQIYKDIPLFAGQYIEANPLPTEDDMLQRRREYAAYSIKMMREREQRTAEKIASYKQDILRIAGREYLDDLIAREEDYRSSSENYWYGVWHRITNRARGTPDRLKPLLAELLTWPDFDFSACELLEYFQTIGDSSYQNASQIRHDLDDLQSIAYIRLSCGRDSKATGIRVIAWRLDLVRTLDPKED